MPKISSTKVYHVDGLPDETFESEADAAVASILVMMNADGNNWDLMEQGLRANAADIAQCLRIIMEPKNAQRGHTR